MPARRGILVVVLCGGVVLDSAPLARPQEAISLLARADEAGATKVHAPGTAEEAGP